MHMLKITEDTDVFYCSLDILYDFHWNEKNLLNTCSIFLYLKMIKKCNWDGLDVLSLSMEFVYTLYHTNIANLLFLGGWKCNKRSVEQKSASMVTDGGNVSLNNIFCLKYSKNFTENKSTSFIMWYGGILANSQSMS